ncbi:hypothetical protein [Pseudaquabacterium terrae]|nr:hypothetical protein [Aquabacterium terrae]
MRRFGIHASDLTIDFAVGNESVLVTRILEQCAGNAEEGTRADFFRELSVGRRIERLLTLAADGERSAFSFPFHCTGCNQQLEFELTLEEIRELQRHADSIDAVAVEFGGQSFEFRKPCGRDQETWGAMSFADQSEAMRVMLGSLALKQGAPRLGLELIDLVDDAMDEADPLVNFRCQITCAECAATNAFSIDLCEVALAMLRGLQTRLIVQVHRLASHYHWSEQEIFAVPHWRRKQYLNLIAAGGS